MSPLGDGAAPAEPGSQRLTKAMRLRRRAEFLALSADGEKLVTRHFVVLVRARADAAPARLGLTVTKKVGVSPVRNRIRRLAREWLRVHGWFAAGWDVVLIAKQSAARLVRRDELAGDLAFVQRHLLARSA